MRSHEMEAPPARGLGRSLRLPACLLGGPALWLGAMASARSLAQWRCGMIVPVVIHAVAAAGCLLIVHMSLRSVRGEGREVETVERAWYFAAGFIAVLCMTGIAATAVASAVAGSC